jgi:hypothetical protein
MGFIWFSDWAAIIFLNTINQLIFVILKFCVFFDVCGLNSYILVLFPMGTGGPFPGGKARPGCDADHSPQSSAEVVNE